MDLAVGLLHFSGPPVVGGVETVVTRHARLLAAAGHRVRLIVGRGRLDGPRVATHLVPLADTQNAAVMEMQQALDTGTVPPAFDRLADEAAAGLIAAAGGLDVVAAHNVCSLDLDAVLTAGLARAIATGRFPPVVAWSHDISAATPRHAARLHPGPPWDLFRTAWPGVTLVTVSGTRRAELAAALGIPETGIAVVPNGVDRGAFLGLPPATRHLVTSLALDDAHPVLLTPARVTPRKNLELAAAVVTELRREGGDARVLITGAPDPHDPEGRSYQARLRADASVAERRPLAGRPRPPPPVGSRGRRAVPDRGRAVPAEPRRGLRPARPRSRREPAAHRLHGHPGVPRAGR
jgi:glycosyltransferase involved in cell wall biosynthesis